MCQGNSQRETPRTTNFASRAEHCANKPAKGETVQLSFGRSNARCVWKGEFQIPGRTPAPQPARARSRRSRSTSGGLLPRGGRAGGTAQAPEHPNTPLCPPPRDEEPHGQRRLGREFPPGALGLGSRRSHSPSRSRGSWRAAPRVPQSPGSGAHRGAGYTGALCPPALRARQRSAEGEEPRRCPAAWAPRGAAPGPGRAPAAPRHPGRALRHHGKLRALLTEVK